MTTRVSVVINNYNYGRFLPMAIDSALSQSYAEVEVVVVDDGSTDDSRRVLEGYGDRVRVVLRENGGQAAAINSGFAASTGDVVLFLDADDELLPDACARIVAVLRPGTGKVHFRLEGIDAHGQSLGWCHPSRAVDLPCGDLSGAVLSDGAYVTPVMSGNAFPRSVLDRVLPVPEDQFRISADGYLVTAAALAGPVLAIDEPLGRYRLHGANAWSTSSGDDLARVAAYVRHDLARHDALRRVAGSWGLVPAPDMGRRDPAHLQRRLASLRFTPSEHPVATDRRLELAVSGAVAAARRGQWSARRRLMHVCWFLLMAVLPERPARAVAVRGLVARTRTPRPHPTRPATRRSAGGRVRPRQRTDKESQSSQAPRSTGC